MNRKLFSIGLVCLMILCFITDSIYAQGSRPIVRIIYFLPANTQPQRDIDAKLDRLIKNVQKFYADEMERHGFGRKTFLFETDTNGNAVVHHFSGKLRASEGSYGGESGGRVFQVVKEEVNKKFDTSQNIYFLFPEFSYKVIGVPGTAEIGNGNGGLAITNNQAVEAIPLTGHEIGHIFGLGHDYRGPNYLMRGGFTGRVILSYCAAEWLNVHRAFNTHQSSTDKPATIKMLKSSLASPPNTIRLQFEVSDPDRLHQAQLFTNEVGLAACKRLNGTRNTVEFLTTYITPNTQSVSLVLIDNHGNISGKRFPINAKQLLPSSKVVSIPDRNLAVAVREQLGLSRNAPITTHAMLGLTGLYAKQQITDLTGLEHAINLQSIAFDKISTSNMSALSKLTKLQTIYINDNTISDISALTGLTQLQRLELRGNNISDITSLAGMTQLWLLSLDSNNISDITPLAGMTQLKHLYLQNNTISDISPLTELKQLQRLELYSNNISDITPLAGMTQLWHLSLDSNNISDITPLAGMTELKELSLSWNVISDLSAFAGIRQLTSLGLRNNRISDISPLQALTQLEILSLGNNRITDISPLVGLSLTGQRHTTGLHIEGNPLSYTSVYTHIPAMREKGINVNFNTRIPTKLLKISGDGQQGLVSANLPIPFVVEVQDQYNRAFAGVPVRFTITDGNGKLSTTTTTTDTTGRTQTRLTFGENGGTTTVSVTAAEISQPVQFTATAIPFDLSVDFPDTNLHSKIAETLGKPNDATLTVADMLSLVSFTANNSGITDLTGLQYASNLETLILNDNNLEDLEILTAFTQLTTLSLENNNISDIALLAELTQLKTLRLRGNLLNYPSLYTHIPVIQARGTAVSVDNRIPTTLLNISSTHGFTGTRTVSYVKVQDENGIEFPGVPVTIIFTDVSGQVSTVKSTTGQTGIAWGIFTLGSTVGKNTLLASVPEISESLSFSITGIDANTPVQIPDANLRAKIAAALSKSQETQLTAGDMLKLTTLNARNANIRDLTGIEHAHNLRTLYLGSVRIAGQGWINSNKIADFSPLESLSRLGFLSISSNAISDISFLTRLTQLQALHLFDNAISDVSPLTGLSNLTSLWLNSNTISDVSPLAGLTQLQTLALDDNNLSDVSPLAELTQLIRLMLDNNNISDISSFTTLTQLTELILDSNNFTDISSISKLTSLTYLSLKNNTISDVSPLVGLNLTGTRGNRTGLYLEGNPLNYNSIHTHIPAMQARGIRVSFHNIAHPELLLISGDNQADFGGKLLTSPFIVQVIGKDGKPAPNLSVTFTVTAGGGQLTNTTTTTDSEGKAQSVLRLGWTQGTNTVRVTANGIKQELTFTATVTIPETQIAEDVNRDGSVDVEDLILVAATMGTSLPDGAIPNTDINGDGVVNREDMELVLDALNPVLAAPTTDVQLASLWTAANLQRWIDEAKQITNKTETFLRGIAALEQLLASLLPKETALLTNYPNPFNPETWIPYHLAEPAEVLIRIYSINGTLIRTLALGHQSAGIYEDRGRAAYWDGRNEQAERVASGIYFYTLTAGDFTSTRKMLIRK